MAASGRNVHHAVDHGHPGQRARSEWLTYDELAAALKVSKRTLWRWVALGKLTPHRISGWYARFKLAEVEAELLTKRRRKR